MWDGDTIERNGEKYKVTMSFVSSINGIKCVHLLRPEDETKDVYTLRCKTDGTEEMKKQFNYQEQWQNLQTQNPIFKLLCKEKIHA